MTLPYLAAGELSGPVIGVAAQKHAVTVRVHGKQMVSHIFYFIIRRHIMLDSVVGMGFSIQMDFSGFSGVYYFLCLIGFSLHCRSTCIMSIQSEYIPEMWLS